MNGTAIYYEVGGRYRDFHSWDCPDGDETNELTRDDKYSSDYAVCAFDRTNGDKLMPLYDDWTFRPTAEVTVQEARRRYCVFHAPLRRTPFMWM